MLKKFAFERNANYMRYRVMVCLIKYRKQKKYKFLYFYVYYLCIIRKKIIFINNFIHYKKYKMYKINSFKKMFLI